MSISGDGAQADALNDFVSCLIDAHRTGTRFVPKERLPETSEEAFAVQSAVMERFGPPGAFKVASKAGAPFVMAPIRADRVFRSGDAVPFIDRAGIELEIGFEVLSPLPRTDDLAVLATCLRPLPAIEIVDTRIAGPQADQPFVKLADQQANGALVIGRPLNDWDGDDFSRVHATLAGDAAICFDAEATVPGGSALTLVAELARRIGNHCGGLKPGQILITGSLNGLPYLSRSADIVGAISELGQVACRVTRRSCRSSEGGRSSAWGDEVSD